MVIYSPNTDCMKIMALPTSKVFAQNQDLVIQRVAPFIQKSISCKDILQVQYRLHKELQHIYLKLSLVKIEGKRHDLQTGTIYCGLILCQNTLQMSDAGCVKLRAW